MLCLELDDFSPRNVFYGNPIKNNIITNGAFNYIHYTTHDYSLNIIYLHLPTEKGAFTAETIQKVKRIEQELLNSSKTKQLKITQCLYSQHIDGPVILKISGVWETDTACGVTFKIIHLPKNAKVRFQ